MLAPMAQWKEFLSTEPDALKRFAEQYQVHPLALEDCFNRDQRAKLEDYGNHQFLVWFLYADETVHELQFLIFPDLVVLVAHDPPPRCSTWKEFLKVQETPRDLPHLLYHALDQITDLTYNEVRRLFFHVQKFEQELFDGDTEMRSILPTKKILSAIEMQMGHLPSIAQQLQNFFHPKDDLKWKFRDLHDHCERLYQSVIFHQGQIASAFDLYWAVASQRTNLQVKKLTLLASIAVPMTFWASFWGMNFQTIPYEDPLFFALAMTVMFGSVIGAFFFLKAKGYWTSEKL